ncbi:MAG: lysoplasmalogenase [Clostridiales bacterium]|nr:lysoplasmalogenase [Clostridiales bacterium]
MMAWIVFLAAAAAHLYACLTRRETLRRWTKPMLMPLLAVCYALSASAISAYVVTGLLLGCAGDCLLLKLDTPARFAAGLFAFLLGHVCYILFMLPQARYPAWYILIPLCLLYCASGALLYRRLKNHMPAIAKPAIIAYMAVICLMSAYALFYLYGGHAVWAFAGSLLFIASDGILASSIFLQKPKHGNFPIMLAYIAAQTLLTLGFV